MLFNVSFIKEISKIMYQMIACYFFVAKQVRFSCYGQRPPDEISNSEMYSLLKVKEMKWGSALSGSTVGEVLFLARSLCYSAFISFWNVLLISTWLAQSRNLHCWHLQLNEFDKNIWKCVKVTEKRNVNEERFFSVFLISRHHCSRRQRAPFKR